MPRSFLRTEEKIKSNKARGIRVNGKMEKRDKGGDRREIFSSHLCDFVYMLTVFSPSRNVKVLLD